jgi:Icc-related predicted phosphoesterase
MKVTCISDIHGIYPKLPGGDLLIFAGDAAYNGTNEEAERFLTWMVEQDYAKKVLIKGNHDESVFQHTESGWNWRKYGLTYLEDSGTEFMGLKIWGSPWTKTFRGMNRRCKHFTKDTEEEMNEQFALIPSDTDILVTHSPPHEIFDTIATGESVGSSCLKSHVMGRIFPKLHVFGHIHEDGGRVLKSTRTTFVNASIMDECYDPINSPIQIEIPLNEPN